MEFSLEATASENCLSIVPRCPISLFRRPNVKINKWGGNFNSSMFPYLNNHLHKIITSTCNNDNWKCCKVIKICDISAIHIVKISKFMFLIYSIAHPLIHTFRHALLRNRVIVGLLKVIIGNGTGCALHLCIKVSKPE